LEIIIVATRCHILRLKCTEFDFGWDSAPDPAGGSAPDPAGRAHSAPSDHPTGFHGVLLLSKEVNGMEEKGKGTGNKRRQKGREGKEGR